MAAQKHEIMKFIMSSVMYISHTNKQMQQLFDICFDD